MQFKKIALFLVFISFLSSCNDTKNNAVIPQIIPIPSSQILLKGVFNLNNSTSLIYEEEFKVAAHFLKEFVENGSSIKLSTRPSKHTISFIKDNSIVNEEGYILDISTNIVNIKASTPKGAFYAVQSLRQLLPPTFENNSYKNKSVSIQALKIKDNPQFRYRGMHLDVGRHFFSVDFIKKYIDALALLKMNTFHWHLTEDQGWRIEIKKYPKLTEIGAYRNETLIGHYNDQPQQFDGKRYGGYYTQEQIKTIVAYAKNKNVTIIPEIELPGHSQAAIAAYPELGCTDQKVEVATKWGVFENLYCPKESTFKFLENVLDEVIQLFPSKYIHIGGDEAPKTQWEHSKFCQDFIKSKGLKDEHELQSYFIARIERYLNSKGKQIIGWDEILEGGLAPNATVMSWRGVNGAVEAAKAHHDVILTPTSHTYFDYYQSDNNDEPLAIGGFLPLKKVYNFNPIPEALTFEESKYVLGAQGNVWTEYMPTQKHVEYMAFPRILALSEVVWSLNKNKNYLDFASRVENFNNRLDALDINYANHLYEIDGKLLNNNHISYQLNTILPGKDIKYTIDGSKPTINSEVYTEAIPITKSVNINAAVFNKKMQIGRLFTEHINYHKAVGGKVILNVNPNAAYNAGGIKALINGINGNNKRYGDKEWLGFWGDDVEIIIDLGKETEVNSIATRFYNANGQWIYAPKHIKIGFSLDGNMNNFNISSSAEITISSFKTEFNSIKARYIKLEIPNYGVIPKDLQGAGNKAWTFIDEIVIN
ncbi:beta-N-acetylhexosaminidase [Flavobacteriaceae bacterium AU392]|nr:beta-N-acetylhexosaminidase [Flavobacteriaceae bacterium]RKM86112.1 beta-N-acetylhexosaminidase [Flavobacteriaceae bacterium AU392]